MRILLSFYLLLLSTGLFAESTFPDGCRAVPVQGQSVTLKAKKNKLVFIHNVTNLDLWITHPVTDPGPVLVGQVDYRLVNGQLC